MGTIPEVEVPVAGFALEETLDAVPGAVFELVRVVAHDQPITIPYLWAMTDDLPALREALAIGVDIAVGLGGKEYVARTSTSGRATRAMRPARWNRSRTRVPVRTSIPTTDRPAPRR